MFFVVSNVFFFFSSRRRHTRCALVTGVQTCALPILPATRLLYPGWSRLFPAACPTPWTNKPCPSLLLEHHDRAGSLRSRHWQTHKRCPRPSSLRRARLPSLLPLSAPRTDAPAPSQPPACSSRSCGQFSVRQVRSDGWVNFFF